MTWLVERGWRERKCPTNHRAHWVTNQILSLERVTNQLPGFRAWQRFANLSSPNARTPNRLFGYYIRWCGWSFDITAPCTTTVRSHTVVVSLSLRNQSRGLANRFVFSISNWIRYQPLDYPKQLQTQHVLSLLGTWISNREFHFTDYIRRLSRFSLRN